MRFTDTMLRGSAIPLLLTLLLLSGCGNNPAGPVDHHRPAVGTRYVYDVRLQGPDPGEDTTFTQTAEVTHSEEWLGFDDIHHIREVAPAGDIYLLSLFENVRYLENGNLRYIIPVGIPVGDTFDIFDYPFGDGETQRSKLEGEDGFNTHVTTYEGEEELEIDGTPYTARVVYDSLFAFSDGHPGLAIIYKITASYVPELGALARVRIEVWSGNDPDDLFVTATYTLRRIEE